MDGFKKVLALATLAHAGELRRYTEKVFISPLIAVGELVS